MSCTNPNAVEGSPPRVRGKEFHPVCIASRIGITPACAGKSESLTRQSIRGWDHPRVCGEKVPPVVWLTARVGSPPRVRGKVIPACLQAVKPGITPACAGKSVVVTHRNYPQWDHPRVCGEKGVLWLLLFRLAGSPPRVRGKAVRFAHEHDFFGITPACAGKSLIGWSGRIGKRDHPRVCGEKFAYLFFGPAL